MLRARLTGLRATRQLQCQAQRRYESHETGTHGKQEGQHAAPVNESLGNGFWFAVALVPISYAVYYVSRNSADDEQPLFTRLIEKYGAYKQTWTDRNTLHTRAVEEAAFDRNLFQSSEARQNIDLKFPEVFNTGSPWAVPAGHYTNLSALIAHYEKQNREQEAKTLERMERMERMKRNGPQ